MCDCGMAGEVGIVLRHGQFAFKRHRTLARKTFRVSGFKFSQSL